MAAHAQTGTPRDSYVITSAPYVINKAGYYILGNNLNYAGTSGNIIDIKASNVTLDFNSFYIAGLANNANQTTHGVNALEQSNLTIKNGTIAFCDVGVSIAGNGNANTNSVGHQIDSMRMAYCYSAGVFVSASPASRVTNCQVSGVGNDVKSQAQGIVASGSGITISNNAVSAISNKVTTGINAGAGCFVRQNTINNAVYGVSGGKYQDNLTYGCPCPYANGIDAGGNN